MRQDPTHREATIRLVRRVVDEGAVIATEVQARELATLAYDLLTEIEAWRARDLENVKDLKTLIDSRDAIEAKLDAVREVVAEAKDA